ncbi:hypothetical protein CMI37_05330 [Candidatus Pacearchaeota archaeon]|nr:hypothetical protein [Candidatus Pacearchaeota archaeon]|tara:strand:+ start:1443 stop:2444 length:1002 start_codon:yes stop_codon:yes gene_type:complete
MAKSVTFQTGTNSSVVIGTEVTPGTATAADGTTLEMPVTEYSFTELNKHTLGIAPFRSGIGGMTQSDLMVKQQKHDRMHEISLTFHCSAQAIDRVCLALFGDGATPNALLGSMPTEVQSHIKHGVANITPVTIWFENAGHAGLGTDMYFTSCVCTSFTMTGDVGSNGGIVMGTATFVTGYAATEATLTFTGGTHTLLTAQTTIFNMHDMTTAQTLDGEDLVLYSFDLNISRPVTRISFDQGNSFRPAGYAVGGYEVTGSLTCSRDGEIVDAIDKVDGAILSLDTGVFHITAPDCMIDETSINFDEDGWKQVVPFRCVYSGATSSTVVSIATAA